MQVFLYQNFHSRFDKIVSALFFKMLDLKQGSVTVKAFNYTNSIALNTINYLFSNNSSFSFEV